VLGLPETRRLEGFSEVHRTASYIFALSDHLSHYDVRVFGVTRFDSRIGRRANFQTIEGSMVAIYRLDYF
jgi:hypothetical protein